MTRPPSGPKQDGNSEPIHESIDADAREVGLKSRQSSGRNPRRPSNMDWKHSNGSNGSNEETLEKRTPVVAVPKSPSLPADPSTTNRSKKAISDLPAKNRHGSWSISQLGLFTAVLGLVFLGAILKSLVSRQLEPKGCRMSYMRPSYIHYHEFDTEHTRFATKYSLYLYREQGFDDEQKVQNPSFFWCLFYIASNFFFIVLDFF